MLMKSNPRRLCSLAPAAMPVQNGLAMTPSQMYELQKRGLPISSQTSSLVFDDGMVNCAWDVSPEYRRGVDPADLYEMHREMSKKVGSAFHELLQRSKREESAPSIQK